MDAARNVRGFALSENSRYGGIAMKQPRRFAFLVGLVASFAMVPASAQVTLNSGPFASAGSQSNKHVVRDSGGQLYCLSVSQDQNGDRPLLLLRSSDGGLNWQSVPAALNTAATGLTGAYPTTCCSLAIDDQDRLHYSWASYYYPSNYQQWYGQYEPATGQVSAPVDITAFTGASAGARTSAIDLTVDEHNTVWLVAHGPLSWVEELVHSTTAYASTLSFTMVGPISSSYSSQRTRLCVDTGGRVHCSYYRNTGVGNYEHRFYDALANTWGPETPIGDTTGVNDYNGSLAADALGNVHALVVKNSTSTSALWEFRYRRWNAQSGWGNEVFLFDAASNQHSGIANDRIFTVACNEATGSVTAIYRDLSAGGLLRTATKDLIAPSFSAGEDLTSPSMGAHAYYVPYVRGSLFPSFNRTGSDVDVTWQHRAVNGAPPYDLVFERVDATVGTNFCQLSPNTTGLAAQMTVQGSASLFANDLVLGAVNVPAGKPGIFLMGTTEIVGFPYGDGFYCVGGMVSNVYPVVFADASGQLTSAIDNTLPAYASLTPGSTYSFQALFRDHAPFGSGLNLSDGMTITFSP